MTGKWRGNTAKAYEDLMKTSPKEDLAFMDALLKPKVKVPESNPEPQNSPQGDQVA